MPQIGVDEWVAQSGDRREQGTGLHRAIATLDLRIDYMKPAEPHCDIFIEAECLKVTHEIAFTRGIAYQDSREAPIALSTGAFMLIRPSHSSDGG